MSMIRKIKQRFAHRSSCEALILMYHRIHEVYFDPGDICVSVNHFKEQLQVLYDHYTVYPLSALSNDLLSQKEKKSIFITFDDGYADNYERAIPLLSELGLPATFFIPTLILQEEKYFWWEIIDYIFGHEFELPEEFILSGLHDRFKKKLSKEVRFFSNRDNKKWSANMMPPPDDRSNFYVELCEWIKSCTADDQGIIADQLLDMFRIERYQDIGFNKMTRGQIAALSRMGFELGAHTVRHPALGFQLPEVQQQEIVLGKKQLEDLAGKEITSLAYPHGHYTGQTISLVQNAGYSMACTTEEGIISNDSNMFTLPRIWIKDIDGLAFKRQLNDLFDL